MNINSAYKLVDLILNKSQQGNITPDQFNLAAEVAQMSVINQLLGNEQEYQPGVPIPRYGFGLNQKIQEDLRVITKVPTALVFTSGVATYPTDSLYLFDLAETTGGNEIRPCEIDEARILNQSQIKPPISGKAVYYVLGANIYVLPTSIVNTLVTYVRIPATPLWNYTTVNNQPVYSASGSQDFELGPLTHFRIVCKILQYFGLNLSVEAVTQYGLSAEAQGQ